MSRISANLRELVIKRAKGKCEYCLIYQDFSIYSHEIDHIIAVKHGGKTVAENLALACLFCNRYKGSDFATIEPNTAEVTLFFNPRRQKWTEHFILAKSIIEGTTVTGQATARLLKFNISIRILERQTLINEGYYP